MSRRPTAQELIDHFDLQPLPVEGGLFTQTWRSAHRVGSGRPAGTAIIAMLTDEPDSFSAVHRLPATELWHFYLGDPIQMLLLHPGGRVERPLLGPDVTAGHSVQVAVSAGTWMAARLARGGEYGLFGCTMAPGFRSGDYEGGTVTLADDYPEAADEIVSLIRPEDPWAMPPGFG